MTELRPQSRQNRAGEHAAESVERRGDGRGGIAAEHVHRQHRPQAGVLHADFYAEGSLSRLPHSEK